VAAEQAIALKLFPCVEPALQSRWQQALVGQAYALKRMKLELADTLTLRANCLYELGVRGSNIQVSQRLCGHKPRAACTVQVCKPVCTPGPSP